MLLAYLNTPPLHKTHKHPALEALQSHIGALHATPASFPVCWSLPRHASAMPPQCRLMSPGSTPTCRVHLAYTYTRKSGFQPLRRIMRCADDNWDAEMSRCLDKSAWRGKLVHAEPDSGLARNLVPSGADRSGAHRSLGMGRAVVVPSVPGRWAVSWYHRAGRVRLRAGERRNRGWLTLEGPPAFGN
ncbi:hypothetical protein K491DRAFT_113514 [Lophiostoma macrostomum CBS 122681]|uniref:Uncharacterized protein n=1 Tax=Lophiostoma macrostomum CBS 122681 TaxID=1314788 RepID=A0A6A6STN3_9PLEO|nr:hypothetical protein K491DRAFT_113514 [Lophiostoma macrostomum CBS 122681]